MNLFVRLLLVLLSSYFRRRLDLLEASVLKFRVWPNDLDIYGHMNNGRYLTIMDLGRMDLIWRTGMSRVAGKRKWNPLVASSIIRYKKSLALFQAYELHSRIVCWNDRWFFIEQRFRHRGHDVAVGWVKGLFYGPQGKVPTGDVARALNFTRVSPQAPEEMRSWLDLENLRKSS